MIHLSLSFASKDIETDPLGHQTVKRYDGLRRILSITNADSRSKRYEYDGVNLTRESDWKGQFTSYHYDRVNRLTEMIDRVGQLTTISYNDTNGLTKTITDRRTNQRVESYDALGRMSSVRVGGQLLASYEYDAGSNRTAMIDGRNNRTDYSYDAFNRVTSVNHAGIQTETFGYDDSGNLTSYFDGRGGSVGQSFDELNRMVSRTDGAGNTTQFKYDGRGLLTELIEPKRDAQNNPVSRTQYEYNELGSLTKVTDANQGVWQYGYDAEQKLTSITDAEGRVPTTFEYDVLHRMTKTTRPLGMVTSASFDANSNRKTSVDPSGRKTTTTYDALDRAKTIAISNSDNSIPQGRSGYVMDYDPEGNLLSVVEQIRSGATTNTRNYSRTYDSRNRLTSTTDPYNRRVSYGYDATNNVTSFTDGANRQTGYSYDAMNRLDVATLPGGRQVNHDWTADGLLSRVDYGNGMSRVYGYDNADRVTSIINTHSGSENEEFAYSYDANSNRESEIRKRNGSNLRTINYSFDALNRLTQASYGGGASVSYGYDKVGNRLSELGTEVGGVAVNRSYTYNALNQLSGVTDALTPGQSSTLSYDLNGNLLKEAKPNGEEKRYEYDALNQMTRAASFANSTETTLGSYDYDFEGKRIAKTVGSSTTQYVYSGINVVNEFNGASQLTASYDFGADLLRSDFAGEGERMYFHDALGPTTSLATSTGATVARYEYDAWGKLISTVQPSANKVNYTGYRRDDETGLDYAQARYYDSTKGRFTSFDPITENGERMNQPQGMNYYGYVMGNPLKYTDPKGTDWIYNTGDKNFYFRKNGDSQAGDVPVVGYDKYLILTASGEYADFKNKWVLIDPKIEGKAGFHTIGDASQQEIDSAMFARPYVPDDGSAAPLTKSEQEANGMSGWSGFAKIMLYDVSRRGALQYSKQDLVEMAKHNAFFWETVPKGVGKGLAGMAVLAGKYSNNQNGTSIEMAVGIGQSVEFWGEAFRNPDELHEGLTRSMMEAGPRETFNAVGETAGETVAVDLVVAGVPQLALRFAGASELPDMVHLTSPGKGELIDQSQKIGGQYGVYAMDASKVPASNAGRIAMTQAYGDLSTPVAIPKGATELFTRSPAVPIGPVGAIRYYAGVRNAPLGSIELGSGRLIKNEVFVEKLLPGNPFRQATWYERSIRYPGHRFIAGYGIDSLFHIAGTLGVTSGPDAYYFLFPKKQGQIR